MMMYSSLPLATTATSTIICLLSPVICYYAKQASNLVRVRLLQSRVIKIGIFCGIIKIGIIKIALLAKQNYQEEDPIDGICSLLILMMTREDDPNIASELEKLLLLLIEQISFEMSDEASIE